MVKINLSQAKFLGIIFLTILTVLSLQLQNDYLLIPVLIVLIWFIIKQGLFICKRLGDKQDG